MTDLPTLKQRACAAVDELADELFGLARRMYAEPELSGAESRASAWLADLLEAHGFTVQRAVAGLPTAFRADWGNGGPALGFLAEYDALPVVGHGCGHNIIGTSCAGAAIAVARALQGSGLPARAVVMGCPDEELNGGKVPMVKHGAFAGLDACMQVHPSTATRLWAPTPAALSMLATFNGKAAHTASVPWLGVNALNAAVLCINALGLLKQHMTEDVRIPATITDGGGVPNVVSERAEVRIHITVRDPVYLHTVIEQVMNCARGAALATGATVEFWQSPVYLPHRPNGPLGELLAGSLRDLGLTVSPPLLAARASTDVGNVSQEIPTACALLSIAPPSVKGHTHEMAAATVTAEGRQALLDAAKAMAMTALAVYQNPALLEHMRRDFALGPRCAPGTPFDVEELI